MTDQTVFTAPTAGYYNVAAKIYRCVPTGKMIEVKNPNRRWYTPWEPKTVMVPKFETFTEYSGRETRYMKAGETAIGPGFRLKC